jgi:hypothetical protein
MMRWKIGHQWRPCRPNFAHGLQLGRPAVA